MASVSSATAAPVPPPVFPDAITCVAPNDESSISTADRGRWSACEKWVWSCVRQGLEANLYAKACFVPRQDEAKEARAKYRLVPFVSPDDYKSTNALSDKFLIAILSDPAYTQQIPPIGVRIFGAYFADPVNLENVTTTINLVLDASVARQGLRMTNFRSSKNIAIDGSNIRGTVHLMRARIDGSVFLEKAVLDHIDFNDARIGSSLEATGSLFNGEFRMMRSSIDGKVILTKARLTSLIAWNAHVGSSLEMRLADIRIGADFTGSTVDGDVRLPEVSFGRRDMARAPHCDWDPDVQADHILSMLKTLLPPDTYPGKFDLAWKEVTAERDIVNGVPAKNACDGYAPITQTSAIDNLLLRDMKIKGTLCVVDISGEITEPRGANGVIRPALKTISLDGTEAKSTVLSWPASKSSTEWRAVNYKTEYLLINLNSQPLHHYVDNLDLRLITLLKKDQKQMPAPPKSASDEHLVKLSCDITPGIETKDDASNRDTQDRLIRFFKSDKSSSAQPFAAVVASLNSSGVNTVHLRKALSELKYVSACTSSELVKAYRDLPWGGFRKAWATVMDKRPPETSEWRFIVRELRSIGVDAGCNAWLFVYRHTVSYGHEPIRLAGWIMLAVLTFWFALKFDSPNADIAGQRKSFGIVYAVDNLIPLKQYRVDPERADETPNSGVLKWWHFVHRLLGLFFALMIFFYVYKAST
ncbi:MAG: hypothetical protein ABL897_01555 [Hyphomicrobium sp.]